MIAIAIARPAPGLTWSVQVDIDAVRDGVLEVVGTTLRPAHASVWLRAPGR